MKKKLTIFMAFVMCVMALAGCGGSGGTDKPLVVGYSNFSSKFSPFFAETAYDQDVAKMTSVYLLNTDRQGAVVEKGKTGETRHRTAYAASYRRADGRRDEVRGLHGRRSGEPVLLVSRLVHKASERDAQAAPKTSERRRLLLHELGRFAHIRCRAVDDGHLRPLP